MKRLALQNKQFGVLRMAFRARKVFGTFEKRVPAVSNFGVNSCRFFAVPRVLIVDARSFETLAAILDYVTHLASVSCWYLLYCEFQKYEDMTKSVVGGQPIKHANTSCKATKHIERTFPISDYY